jgi:hypothetical protein
MTVEYRKVYELEHVLTYLTKQGYNQITSSTLARVFIIYRLQLIGCDGRASSKDVLDTLTKTFKYSLTYEHNKLIAFVNYGLVERSDVYIDGGKVTYYNVTPFVRDLIRGMCPND